MTSNIKVILGVVADMGKPWTLQAAYLLSTPKELRLCLEHHLDQFQYDPDELQKPGFWESVLNFQNYEPDKYTIIDMADAGFLALVIIGESESIRSKFTIEDVNGAHENSRG